MKTLAYLDCPTGIAGDMCLGALVHAGVPLDYLKKQLARLGIQNEFHLRAESVQRNHQIATKVYVDLLRDPQAHSPHSHEHSHSDDHDHSHNRSLTPPFASRRLPDIEALIQQANLPANATAWSLAIFRRLAEAEAAVHGIPPEQVHFHEVGAVDAIVDIVGTCLGFDWLKVDGWVCSPLPTGGGMVRCDHGLLPVPVPAVLNMMASGQIPVYSNGIDRELVTPTGCAIALTLAESFGPPPRFTLQKIGLGAGGRDLAVPNILRLWIGTVDQSPSAKSAISGAIAQPHIPPTTETITELQTQLDDVSPQAIGYVFEQLFAAGAVDVFTQAVAMKKNRLGTVLTVLCPESAIAPCEALLFRETTTLGIRRTEQTRSVLMREMVTVSTAYGDIAVKVARSHVGAPVLNMQPEYEDCAKVARSHSIPWLQVHQAAIAAAIESGLNLGET
ncbi:MAG: nickel pincer cofactor biosynthesis protein LarC [Phormidesmis priestleyi]|uniref:Putative nickel insertion protein n=1 Tax=Phormidesmis priestleyi TaxID=268141 RepID=A0A2W4Z108_9CYAN|nr:MAG: nickel pincer cofactor biosynthesis protein LarC [Phormidesmis priestleyi]